MSNKKIIWYSIVCSLLLNGTLLIIITKQVLISGGLEYGTYGVVGGFPFLVIKWGFSGDIAMFRLTWLGILFLFFQWKFWTNLLIWFFASWVVLKVIAKKHASIAGS